MANLPKTVFILIGPKGSGKTYIGTLIEQRLGLYFFRVEEFWLTLKNRDLTPQFIEHGFTLVEKEIDKKLAQVNELVMESTASFSYFQTFLEHLKSCYQVRLIKVAAPAELCVERIRNRDQSAHIPVSDHMVDEINRLAAQVRLDFDLELDNAVLTDDEIVRKFAGLLRNPDV